MSKLCFGAVCVFGLGAVLGAVGCGGSTSGGPGGFAANFLASEVRIDQALPASFGRAQLPVACCNGATVYAVWEDYRNGESDVLFNVSTNGGSTWQTNNTRVDTGTPSGIVRAVRPAICCDGSNIYVAWIETMGSANFNYYFNRSTDGGATWLPNRVKLDTNPTGLTDGSNPQICCCNNTVIVTWSDNRSGDHQVYIAHSTDAGTTFSEQLIGGMAGFDAHNPRCCCEEVGMVQYAYVAWTDTRLGGGQRVFFDRSIDGGATWGPDTNLDSTSSFFVSDICCDAQYVYVSWLGAAGARTRLRGSSDFGVTFNAEQNLKTAAGGQGFAPRICCEGATVHAAFIDTTGGQADVYYNKSTDAGVTILAAQVRIDNGMAGDTSGNQFICCNGANLTCVFFDTRSGTNDTWASRSADGGATWSLDVRLDLAGGAVSAQNSTVCCSGSNVYAFYTDERDGGGRGQLQINASANDGANWFANDVRVSQPNPPGFNGNSGSVQIAVKGSTVHAVFEDDRLGERRIFYNRSTDNGSTWMSTDVLLDPAINGVDDGDAVLCCSDNNVYVAWNRGYDASGFDDVYVNRSTDGGLTWQPTGTRVSTGVAMDTVDGSSPTLCCAGANVYVAWSDERNGTDHDIWLNRSTDSGATWLAAATRIDNAPATFDAVRPLLCCEGGRLHAVWEDVRNGSGDIYTNRSLDGGVTWQGADTRLDVSDPPGASFSSGPAICCSGTRVYIAWDDDRNGDCDIYCAASTDAGATFGTDTRLDVGAPPGVGDSGDVVLCCDGDRVYAAWVDERATEEDIFFNRSLDAGATWLAADVRIDLGDPPGANDSDCPALCCNGDRVYIAWDDDRPAAPGCYLSASIDAGATWLAAPVLVSAAPQNITGDQQVVCTPSFVYVAWSRFGGGPSDAQINRTTP